MNIDSEAIIESGLCLHAGDPRDLAADLTDKKQVEAADTRAASCHILPPAQMRTAQMRKKITDALRAGGEATTQAASTKRCALPPRWWGKRGTRGQGHET